MSAGTAARAARTSPLPARRRVAVQTSRVPVSRCAWGTARPRHPVSGSRPPGTQAGHPARASPPAESSSPCGAARVRMRHARSLLTAHCSLLAARCSLLTARCSCGAGNLGRRRGGLLRVPADAGRHARHLGGRGGVSLAGHQASGDQLPATSEEPSRAGPRVLADREGHRRPAPLAARRVAPREDPGTLDEKLAHERTAVPRDAAQPPALGARAPRGREAEVGRGPSPGRGAGEASRLGGGRERRGEAPRPSRT